MVEDALALTDTVRSLPSGFLSLDTHILTHIKRETPLAYALKCVIRLSPSRF